MSTRRITRVPAIVRVTRALAAFTACAALTALLASAARATPLPPSQDPFYSYTGATPLGAIAPGTVLKTRTESYHVDGITLPVRAVQLLYRGTTQLGGPTVNVTSVLEPPIDNGKAPNVVAYQSFYDSLSTADDPSYAISGGGTLGLGVGDAEPALIAPLLLAGDAVVVADTEGEQADFAAGPEYGMLTLDSLRAALSSPATGLAGSTEVAMIGYSGGAIATEWASELAPGYAPGLNRLLVGSSFGGVLVDPAHNLHYVNGSALWAGVMPMALIGISRAFHIDLTLYLSAYGQQVFTGMQNDSIDAVLGHYPGLSWSQIAKPQYREPEQIPTYVRIANQLIMGESGTPTEPLLIAQGADGTIEGTDNFQPGIGPGDGVMIAGDVRTLAREYCARGVPVEYDQYDATDHIGTAIPWMTTTVPWLAARFAGLPAPQDCGSIAPGNPVAPIG